MIARKLTLRSLLSFTLCLLSSILIIGCDEVKESKPIQSSDGTPTPSNTPVASNGEDGTGATNDLVTDDESIFGDPKTNKYAARMIANTRGISKLSGDALLVARRVKELDDAPNVPSPKGSDGFGINPPGMGFNYHGLVVEDGQLVEIDLTFSPVTDEDLKLFSKITSLKELRVAIAPNITDAGIAQLAALTNLEKLDISYTHVSDEAREKLQAALPNCKIVQTPLPE